MTAKNNYNTSGIPQQALHAILHYLALQQIKNAKQLSSSSQIKHPHFIFQYYKNFQLISRLKGSALCLLKTQYAKKPKNPV